MIMYLASLKSVPDQLYEAAAIDGANWWQRIWYITLPMMRNIIAITTLFSLIVTFANFDIVRILTAGGPLDHTHISELGVRIGIEGSDIPLGASVSLFMVPILAIAAVFILRMSTNAGMKPDEHGNGRQGRADAHGQVRQHEPRPDLGAAIVLFFPHPVRDLLAGAAALHADYVAQDQRRDIGGDRIRGGFFTRRWKTTSDC